MAAWRKSSHSGGEGGQCVEVASLTAATAVRDSKRPHAAALLFHAAAWDGLVTGLADSR
ncbi:DUF397 domain-containing protein [Streptodolium elevatio]|uniref:DUF397 domain-containing protein n=1 Tax=Streptodolium elevatio TaxID=3157996 RepID=UPI003F4D3E7E